MKLFKVPIVAAIRRNHALEHATMHILSQECPELRLVGRSDWGGFTLYGPVDTEKLAEAVTLAHQRLLTGETELAVHPRCGTNLATGVVLASIASYAVLNVKRRSGLQKALQLFLGIGAALSLAQPLGIKLQEHLTTSTQVAGLHVVQVTRQQRGTVVMHRVETASE
ncbi:MAG: hypothetical protein FJ026_14020 [Chloroflexi bacterium]|nr:hypothetical protein [Chloroflexota bacterium]